MPVKMLIGSWFHRLRGSEVPCRKGAKCLPLKIATAGTLVGHRACSDMDSRTEWIKENTGAAAVFLGSRARTADVLSEWQQHS